MDAPWSAMDTMVDTASAPTITTAATPMFSAPTTGADTTTPMATATTTMGAVLITVTHPPTITVRDTTGGPIIRGPRRSLTDGVGAGRRGMATTDLTSRPIRCTRPQHSG